MKIGSKEIHMDEPLKNKLDFMIKRQKKNFDHLIIVDGKERLGKTTWVATPAWYVAHKTNRQFSNKNYFFDPDKMIDFAVATERQVIIWDEAALGGLAEEWQSKIQKKLVKLLMIAGKKNHFFFFLIPKAEKLKEYIIDRAVGLVHVYSRDSITRGRYVYLGMEAKERLFRHYRKTKVMDYSKYTFHGTFNDDMDKFVDVKQYEAAKDEAIIKAMSDDSGMSVWQLRFYWMQWKAATIPGIKHEELAKHFGIVPRMIYEWRSNIEKYPEIRDRPTPMAIGDRRMK